MKSNIEWRRWGEVDPLFGVASWTGKSKDSPHAWKDEEFYALGKSDWRDFKKHWEQYGLTTGTCLEIGCGAGRITMHLAGDFHIVKAMDVSEGMIEYARARVSKANVEFLLSKGDHLPTPDNSIDAIFSTHVFQHLDHLDDAAMYFREIYRVLRDNGTFMIHLPIYHWPTRRRVYRTLHTLFKRVEDIKSLYLRFLLKRGSWHPLMRYLPYELDWLYQVLDDTCFAGVEVRIVRVKSNNDPHPFVLARKLTLTLNTA